MYGNRITAAAVLTTLLVGAVDTAGIASANAAPIEAQAKSDCIDTLNIEAWDGSGFYVAAVLDWNPRPKSMLWQGRFIQDLRRGEGRVRRRGLSGGNDSLFQYARGHSAPYCPGWSHGDLTEGQDYAVDIFLVKGGTTKFIETRTVHNWFRAFPRGAAISADGCQCSIVAAEVRPVVRPSTAGRPPAGGTYVSGNSSQAARTSVREPPGGLPR
jgi:hypothetical protein